MTSRTAQTDNSFPVSKWHTEVSTHRLTGTVEQEHRLALRVILETLVIAQHHMPLSHGKVDQAGMAGDLLVIMLKSQQVSPNQ